MQANTDQQTTPRRRYTPAEILSWLATQQSPRTTEYICHALGMRSAALRAHLSRMAEEGTITRMVPKVGLEACWATPDVADGYADSIPAAFDNLPIQQSWVPARDAEPIPFTGTPWIFCPAHLQSVGACA
jgi:hypothetical protein